MVKLKQIQLPLEIILISLVGNTCSLIEKQKF